MNLNLTDEEVLASRCHVLRKFDEQRHDLRFLFLSVNDARFDKQLAKRCEAGASIGTRSTHEVAKIPPLPEQQRIVGILDEAFEGIATAKANAEKNLQNARASLKAICNPSSPTSVRVGREEVRLKLLTTGRLVSQGQLLVVVKETPISWKGFRLSAV